MGSRLSQKGSRRLPERGEAKRLMLREIRELGAFRKKREAKSRESEVRMGWTTGRASSERVKKFESEPTKDKVCCA